MVSAYAITKTATSTMGTPHSSSGTGGSKTFVLPVGTYTVTVSAYYETVDPANLVTSGTSPDFTVSQGGGNPGPAGGLRRYHRGCCGIGKGIGVNHARLRRINRQLRPGEAVLCAGDRHRSARRAGDGHRHRPHPCPQPRRDILPMFRGIKGGGTGGKRESRRQNYHQSYGPAFYQLVYLHHLLL
ncbi:hypothetical protein AGMMS49587_17430 [Spirochaetia bacterium]|nr:hypothetical protein AGMMS49587_17430 [Spirochaetia bacterium]